MKNKNYDLPLTKSQMREYLVTKLSEEKKFKKVMEDFARS